MLSVPAHTAAETDEALVTFGTYQTLEYWTITTSALPVTISVCWDTWSVFNVLPS